MIWNIYITIILPKQPPHSTNMSNLSEQWVTLSDRAFSLLSNANQSPWFKTLHTDTSYLIARNKSLMIVQIWPALKRISDSLCFWSWFEMQLWSRQAAWCTLEGQTHNQLILPQNLILDHSEYNAPWPLISQTPGASHGFSLCHSINWRPVIGTPQSCVPVLTKGLELCVRACACVCVWGLLTLNTPSAKCIYHVSVCGCHGSSCGGSTELGQADASLVAIILISYTTTLLSNYSTTHLKAMINRLSDAKKMFFKKIHLSCTCGRMF